MENIGLNTGSLLEGSPQEGSPQHWEVRHSCGKFATKHNCHRKVCHNARMYLFDILPALRRVQHTSLIDRPCLTLNFENLNFENYTPAAPPMWSIRLEGGKGW